MAALVERHASQRSLGSTEGLSVDEPRSFCGVRKYLPCRFPAKCGCSSVDRVLASEAKGRGVDPRQPHQGNCSMRFAWHVSAGATHQKVQVSPEVCLLNVFDVQLLVAALRLCWRLPTDAWKRKVFVRHLYVQSVHCEVASHYI